MYHFDSSFLTRLLELLNSPLFSLDHNSSWIKSSLINCGQTQLLLPPNKEISSEPPLLHFFKTVSSRLHVQFHPQDFISVQDMLCLNSLICFRLQHMFMNLGPVELGAVKQFKIKALALQLVYIVTGSNSSALSLCDHFLMQVEGMQK